MHVCAKVITFLAVSLVGCSSPSAPVNKPPVVDSFDAPATATATATAGVYTLSGMFAVHDDDDTVTQFRVRVDGLPDIPPNTLPTPMMKGSYALMLTFSGSKGATLSYHFTVIDSRGIESAPFDKSVMLP